MLMNNCLKNESSLDQIIYFEVQLHAIIISSSWARRYIIKCDFQFESKAEYTQSKNQDGRDKN